MLYALVCLLPLALAPTASVTTTTTAEADGLDGSTCVQFEYTGDATCEMAFTTGGVYDSTPCSATTLCPEVFRESEAETEAAMLMFCDTVTVTTYCTGDYLDITDIPDGADTPCTSHEDCPGSYCYDEGLYDGGAANGDTYCGSEASHCCPCMDDDSIDGTCPNVDCDAVCPDAGGCTSNSDCEDFCNFDDGTSGACESCANIGTTCEEDGFNTPEGTAACIETCESGSDSGTTMTSYCVTLSIGGSATYTDYTYDGDACPSATTAITAMNDAVNQPCSDVDATATTCLDPPAVESWDATCPSMTMTYTCSGDLAVQDSATAIGVILAVLAAAMHF